MDSPELANAKRDSAFLCSALCIDGCGQHKRCPICKHDCLRVGPDKEGSGVYLWQCMQGCGSGTIVDALMKVGGLSFKQAMDEVRKRHGSGGTSQRWRPGLQPAQKEVDIDVSAYKEYPEPEIDQTMAHEFVELAHRTLLEDEELQKQFVFGKRKLSMEVVEKHRVGFMPQYWVPRKPTPENPRAQWEARFFWSLPITDANGELKAVKLHFETSMQPQKTDKDGNIRKPLKSVWMPFSKNNYHAYNTLWPHPYAQHKKLKLNKLSRDPQWFFERMSDEMHRKVKRRSMELERDMAMSMNCTPSDLTDEEHEICENNAMQEMIIEIRRDIAQRGKAAAEEGQPTIQENMNFELPWILAPGELKALAYCSAGFVATGPTGGENSPPPTQVFSCFRGQNVLVVADDDKVHIAPKTNEPISAGRKFPDIVVPRIVQNHPKKVRVMTHGRMPKEESHP